MAIITKIESEGFKAFSNHFEIDLGKKKNLLVYGENGSGKSSIFYALHALLQSVYKSDKGAKYFNPKDNDEHLVNLFRCEDVEKNGFKPYVRIYLSNGNKWMLNEAGLSSENGGKITEIEFLNRYGVFINHSFISRSRSARNSETIDLWNVFYKDILPFYKPSDTSVFLSVDYDHIVADAKCNPRSNDLKFQGKIEKFNQDLGNLANYANTRISEIYNKNFKNRDDNPLEITLQYLKDDDHHNASHIPYYLFYGKKRFGRNLVKQLQIPHIGIKVLEKLQNGKSLEIPKPQSYFNEAKLTAISLSIRFACLPAPKDDYSFMALDDMIVSLDMSNREKLVSFLLKNSDKYKIYLFTHDKAFFEFFKHKSKRFSSPEEWLYKEIYMDESKSPYLRASKSYLEDAEHYINQHKFEIAGNFLRKEAEAFCKCFLPTKWLLTKDYTCLDLNGMIQNCKKYASESGISDLSLFDELDDYRKFILNSSSHDSYDVVKFKSEVRKCLNTLKILAQAKSNQVLGVGDEVTFTLKTPAPNINTYKFDIQICDELRLIEIPGQPKVLSKVMVNYFISKNGTKETKQAASQTLKKFYDVNYAKSDKTENQDYLESIHIVSSNLPLSSLLK